jgi:hypothetical protein
VVAATTGEADAGWVVRDTWYNFDPNYEYKAYVYRTRPGDDPLVGIYPYTYSGTFDYGGGVYYVWKIDQPVSGFVQGDALYFKVYYRYGGVGDWSYLTQHNATWE